MSVKIKLTHVFAGVKFIYCSVFSVKGMIVKGDAILVLAILSLSCLVSFMLFGYVLQFPI